MNETMLKMFLGMLGISPEKMMAVVQQIDGAGARMERMEADLKRIITMMEQERNGQHPT
jgi:hypothetical protein